MRVTSTLILIACLLLETFAQFSDSGEFLSMKGVFGEFRGVYGSFMQNSDVNDLDYSSMFAFSCKKRQIICSKVRF